VEFTGSQAWTRNRVNIDGPTTYAVGTEGGSLYSWEVPK
jgi:hypothetical protein